jgi:iron complex outermembrane receptor protein
MALLKRTVAERSRHRGVAVQAIAFALLIPAAHASAPDTAPSANALKKMSLAELMNIEVTLVSGRPEKLSETPSAIQVVTGEDIRRAGATNLPEALRLVPNLQVAQVNSYGWVVGARGFNALYSNKLLAMIDGRSIYTPLFAGVSWDMQNVVLEDVDRIEVVSGPGGTLWGANAVNGVINVVSKSARETQGLYLSAAGGSSLEDSATVRYGGAVGDNLAFRVYGLRFDRDNALNADGSDGSDAWHVTQGGFRLDYSASTADRLTLQGDLYGGAEETLPAPITMNGQNLLGRWTRTLSDESDLRLQVYVDRTWRKDVPSTLSEELDSYDIDFQHRFALGVRQSVRWGLGYRVQADDVMASTIFLAILPARKNMQLASGFVQDEIALKPEHLKLTIGTKLEHNDFSGFEVQPSVRLAWTPTSTATLWTAVSRAVRTPSRIDVDYFIPAFPLPPTVPHVAGGPNFDSEKLIAYEAGVRVQPADNLALSLATFYNDYDEVYSVEPLTGTQVYQIQNGIEGQSFGVELSGSWEPTGWWRLRGGFTYLHKDLWNRPGHNFTLFSAIGNDPEHEALLQSLMEVGQHVQLDLTARYLGTRVEQQEPGYFALDARLAWHFKHIELSVTGQNLLRPERAEFYAQRIPRSIYGRFTWRM